VFHKFWAALTLPVADSNVNGGLLDAIVLRGVPGILRYGEK
jgi:hypothetical protein